MRLAFVQHTLSYLLLFTHKRWLVCLCWIYRIHKKNRFINLTFALEFCTKQQHACFTYSCLTIRQIRYLYLSHCMYKKNKLILSNNSYTRFSYLIINCSCNSISGFQSGPQLFIAKSISAQSFIYTCYRVIHFITCLNIHHNIMILMISIYL